MVVVLAAGLNFVPVLAVQNFGPEAGLAAQPGIELIRQFDGPVTAIARTPEGNGLIIASQNRLIVIQREDGTTQREVELASGQLTSVAASSSGEIVWLGGGDPGLVGHRYSSSVDRMSATDPVELHDDVLTGLAVSPDGKWLAASSVDGRGSVSPTTGGEPVWLKGHSLPLTDIGWLDQETILTASEDASLRVWSFSGREQNSPVSPSGEGPGKPQADGVSLLPELEVRLQRTLSQHVGPVLGVCILDGTDSVPPIAASWGQDRTVRIWQPLTGRMVRFIGLPATPRSVAWDTETQQLVAGDQAGQLHWLDWKTGAIIRSVTVDNDWLTAILFAGDGEEVLVGTSGGSLFAVLHPG